MYTEVKEEANNTYEFDRSFLQKIIRKQPLYSDESMDFIFDEDHDTFPIFKEDANPIAKEILSRMSKSKEELTELLKQYPPLETMKADILNTDGRAFNRADALKLYLKGRFNKSLDIMDVLILRINPLKVKVLLSIKNPEAVYQEARSWNLPVPPDPSRPQPTTKWVNNSATEIYYDTETGEGKTGSDEFKFKSNHPAFPVFAEMYQNIGKRVPKTLVLKLAGYKDIGEGIIDRIDGRQKPKSDHYTRVSYLTNYIAKFIRDKTELNENQVVLNNGDLTLKGVVVRKSPK